MIAIEKILLSIFLGIVIIVLVFGFFVKQEFKKTNLRLDQIQQQTKLDVEVIENFTASIEEFTKQLKEKLEKGEKNEKLWLSFMETGKVGEK